jgi:hypothetical protein
MPQLAEQLTRKELADVAHWLKPAPGRVGWAVTKVDGETVLHKSGRFSGRIVELWSKDANRLWRVNIKGDLLGLLEVEYEAANWAARKDRWKELLDG